MDKKINKIALSYLCCLPICNASFHGSNQHGHSYGKGQYGHPYGQGQYSTSRSKATLTPRKGPGSPALSPSESRRVTAQNGPGTPSAAGLLQRANLLLWRENMPELIELIIVYANTYPIFRPEVCRDMPAHDPDTQISNPRSFTVNDFSAALDYNFRDTLMGHGSSNSGFLHMVNRHMADLVDMAAPRGNTFSGQAIFDLLSDDAKALLNLLSPVFPPNTLEWKSVLLFMLLKFSLLRYFFVEIDESNQCVYFCAKFPSPIGTLSPYEASTKTSTETTVKYVRAVFETCKSVKTITAYPASVNKISRGQAVRGGQRSYEAEIPW